MAPRTLSLPCGILTLPNRKMDAAMPLPSPATGSWLLCEQFVLWLYWTGVTNPIDWVSDRRWTPSVRVIFVNRYFHPDLSATSEMLSDLAFAVSERGMSGDGHHQPLAL